MKNKSLAKNAFLSSIKTMFSIIVPLITYPYILRVLSVDNMGRIGFSQSIVSYFTLIATLGISTFAVRNGSQFGADKSKLEKFVNRVFSINIISMLVSYALLIFVLIIPTTLQGYADLILLQSLTILAIPFSVDWIFMIFEDFAYITIRSICIQIISIICMFLFVKSKSDVYIYIIILSSTSIASKMLDFIYARKYVQIKFTRDTNWKEYKGSILLFFLNSITSVIYLNSDVTLLGMIKTDYHVGIYTTAVKIYSIVKQVFNSVVAITIPRLAYLRKYEPIEFEKLVKKMISLTMVFSIPMLVGITILSNDIVELITGAKYIEYKEAASTLSILCIAIFFAVCNNILANGVLVAMEKEKAVVISTIVSALANVVLNFAFIPRYAQNGAAITTVISEIIVFVMCLYHIKGILHKIIEIRVMVHSIIGSCIILATYLLISSMVVNLFLLGRIMVVVVTSVMAYIMFMLVVKDSVVIEIIYTVLKKRKKEE